MTPASLLTLEIVTPDGTRLTEQVRSLTAPSVEGELGILPGHRPLLAALKTGIVSYELEGEGRQVAVGTGMVEVYEDRAVLLTERFTRKQDVDPVQVRLDLKEADEALDRFDGDPASPEYATWVGRELWAAVQLELHGDPPPPVVRTIVEFEARPVEDYTDRETAQADDGDQPAPPEHG
jgi:F-type H+-transporting ATPase subunit epsilon